MTFSIEGVVPKAVFIAFSPSEAIRRQSAYVNILDPRSLKPDAVFLSNAKEEGGSE